MAQDDAVRAVQNQLFSMQDLNYRAFHCKLMPTIAPERVIGVRTPQLRAYAKTLAGGRDAARFMEALPHEYYEENNLHAFLIEEIRDFDACISELNCFLPCVDNWATCDMMRPRVLGKHLPELLEAVKRWICSEHEYAVRFAIENLMIFFLDEAFEEEYLQMVAAVANPEYYVKMMVAWYFATALSKQWDAAFAYIEGRQLDVWVHNKAIQKAIESRRITAEQKEKLKKLRISRQKQV